MHDLYKFDEDCLAFSNETLEKFFEKIKKELGVELKYRYCDDEHTDLFYEIIKDTCEFTGTRSDILDKIHRIDCVSIDGQKWKFDIHFHDSAMVSIFFLTEQFMFIDDARKQDVRSVEGCIIYEGYIRDKTHEQILKIFLDLFMILHGTEIIDFEEQYVSKIGFYKVNNYVVKLTKPNCEKQVIQFENIYFLIN